MARRQGQAALLHRRLAGMADARQLQVKTVAKGAQPGLQAGARLLGLVVPQRAPDIPRHAAGQGDQPGGVRQHPVTLHLGETLVLTGEVAARQQARQLAITLVILRQQHQPVRAGGRGRIAHPQLGAGQGLDARRLRRAVELDQPEEIAQIGERHGRHAVGAQGRHQRLEADEPINQ